MATPEKCEQALHTFADRLAQVDEQTRKKKSLDRSLSCTITDLDVVFGAHLEDGLITGIHRTDTADGQVKLAMTGDDLQRLVDGELNFAKAWANGRIKVDAKITDLLKLRSIF